MKVHLISPGGERVGTFRSHTEAAAHASETWPNAIGDIREEDPRAWEMETECEKRDLRRLRKQRASG